MDGIGEFKWNDKCYYKGIYSEGKKHGFGIFVTNEKILKGYWNCGEL